MIILDTNVVSEALKPQASGAVRSWLDFQIPETLFLTTPSLAELQLGVELMPPGKRKQMLARGLNHLLERLFKERVLPFDADAARAYGKLVSKARFRGRAIAIGDGQIEAVAAVHGFAVATRDTGPFHAAGISVVNPWEA
jgi:toxin FitB